MTRAIVNRENTINTSFSQHYLPNKNHFPNSQSPQNSQNYLKASMASKFDASINKMKTSFAVIEAAKTHTVLLDFVPNKKTSGKAGATIKTVTTKIAKPTVVAEKPVVKPVEAEYTKKPEGIQGVIAEEVISKTTKKPAPKKSSKLSKMLRGKTVDCTA